MFQRWATDTYLSIEEVCSNGGLQILTVATEEVWSNGGLQIPTWLYKYVPMVDYRYLHGYRRGMFQRWATDTYMAIEEVCSIGGLQIPTWL